MAFRGERGGRGHELLHGKGIAAPSTRAGKGFGFPLFGSDLPAIAARLNQKWHSGKNGRSCSPGSTYVISCVRRGKARFPCGCESRPATVAPAGSSQSGLWR